MATDFRVPSAKEVEKFHENADTDGSHQAIHHTIGIGNNQVAAGRHYHNGSDSPLLLEGVGITGSRSGGAALESVIAALVSLGAIDQTTT